jgi:methionine aminotransferase
MKSKLPHATGSIFAIMSKMAADHNALNLSQGFPNFESAPISLLLVVGMRGYWA